MQNKRQGEIVWYLSEVKFSKIEQLAETFQVSIETIHRDLLELGKESSAKRAGGDTVYNNLRAQETGFERKIEKHQIEEQAIARLASEYIDDGDAITMSNRTASLTLARCLAERKNQLTVTANLPDMATALSENKSDSIYLTSGYLREYNRSLVGSIGSDTLGNFRVGKATASIDGISIQDGVTECNTEEAVVLKKMLEIGHTRMILCEFSKFGEVAFNKACSAKQIDYMFTNWNISSKEIKAWADTNVKVVIASRKSVEKSRNCQ